MKETKAAFRTAVGGFNKLDVNNYIAYLCENFEKEKNDLSSQLEILREQLDSYKNRYEETKSVTDEVARLKDELLKANSVVAAQSERCESLNAQLESLREQLQAKESELTDANEKLTLYSDAEEKLKKYEQVSAKVGELILEAASSADKIKDDAKSKAEEIIRESEERVRLMREKEIEAYRLLEDRYKNAVFSVNEKLITVASEGLESLKVTLKAAEDEIEIILERYREEARSNITRITDKLSELKQLAIISDEK